MTTYIRGTPSIALHPWYTVHSTTPSRTQCAELMETADGQNSLAALAAALPKEIYRPLEAIFHHIDNHLNVQQPPAQPSLTANDLRNSLKQAFLQANFVVQPQACQSIYNHMNHHHNPYGYGCGSLKAWWELKRKKAPKKRLYSPELPEWSEL
ncbi:hypothetical protein C8Q76DRAFT_698533 [Earliella scabrosa]|nr:hypothetical protein C8Q76DRAFT_698533 [Earliella scabrosa]